MDGYLLVGVIPVNGSKCGEVVAACRDPYTPSLACSAVSKPASLPASQPILVSSRQVRESESGSECVSVLSAACVCACRWSGAKEARMLAFL